MQFKWDESKNRANFKKHGIWFEEAQTVWSDPHSVEFYDPTHSVSEDRFMRIGHSTAESLLLVIFCERNSGDMVRIISARIATSRERQQYEEGI